MKVVKAPGKYDADIVSVFLAGSIEMGAAENWQERAEKELSPFDINVLNPRRDDWDTSWVQSIDNDKFREQVVWELNGIDNATLVLLHFEPNTKSPITLMELGYLLGNSPNKLIVSCPDGFWRKGNVEVGIAVHGGEMFHSLQEALKHLNNELTKLGKHICPVCENPGCLDCR